MTKHCATCATTPCLQPILPLLSDLNKNVSDQPVAKRMHDSEGNWIGQNLMKSVGSFLSNSFYWWSRIFKLHFHFQSYEYDDLRFTIFVYLNLYYYIGRWVYLFCTIFKFEICLSLWLSFLNLLQSNIQIVWSIV